MAQPKEKSYKVITLGDPGVGKSLFASVFADGPGAFTDYPKSKKKQGPFDCKTKFLIVDGKPVKIELLDTVGLEKWNTIPRQYFHNHDGILIIFDVTNRESFENAENHMEEANRVCVGVGQMMLLANKCDLSVAEG